MSLDIQNVTFRMNNIAERIEREVWDLSRWFWNCSACFSYPLKAEGDLRRSAARLRKLADDMDAIADKGAASRDEVAA